MKNLPFQTYFTKVRCRNAYNHWSLDGVDRWCGVNIDNVPFKLFRMQHEEILVVYIYHLSLNSVERNPFCNYARFTGNRTCYLPFMKLTLKENGTKNLIRLI